MLLSPTLTDALFLQARREMTNILAYDTLAFSTDLLGYANSASRFDSDADDERSHAKKILTFLRDRNAPLPSPTLGSTLPLDIPALSSLLDHYRAALKLEQANTAALQSIAEIALSEKDYPTMDLFTWLQNEQMSSEKELDTACRQLDGLDKGAATLWDLSLAE